MAVQTYRDLNVWKQAMDLVEATYALTKRFPGDERFGLTSQMQRAAVSIPANIAEGNARKHRGDYIHHLSIARGSLAELETHLELAVRLGFASHEEAEDVWQKIQDVGRLLNALISSLSRLDP